MIKSVIMDYDINDYKIKTDLTVEKLVMAMVFSLRTFNNLRQIQAGRDDMRKELRRTLKGLVRNGSSGVLFSQPTD